MAEAPLIPRLREMEAIAVPEQMGGKGGAPWHEGLHNERWTVESESGFILASGYRPAIAYIVAAHNSLEQMLAVIEAAKAYEAEYNAPYVGGDDNIWLTDRLRDNLFATLRAVKTLREG